jgi:hypothetical protein
MADESQDSKEKKVRSGSGGLTPTELVAAGFAGLEPTAAPPKHDFDDRRAELRRITARLGITLEDHRRQAEELREPLTNEDVIKVLDALERHARTGLESRFLSAAGNSEPSVKDCLLDGLYQDLLLEPSNVLYHTHTSPDTIRYEAMQAEFWIDCLRQVKGNLAS